jgi:hypothetical protein
MAPKPYEQGELDGFCSVYSVINAAALAAAPFKHLARKDCLDLFAFLVCALKLNEQLPCVLSSGSYYPTVSRLLKAADCWLANRHRLALDYRRPFTTKPGSPPSMLYAVSKIILRCPTTPPSFASAGPTSTGPSSGRSAPKPARASLRQRQLPISPQTLAPETRLSPRH